MKGGGKGKLLNKFKDDIKVPKGWDTGPARKGDGISFSKPGTMKANEIRIKEGVPGSPYKNSRVPNVRLKKDGKWRDIHGNEVKLDSEAAHIPLEGFKVPDWIKN